MAAFVPVNHRTLLVRASAPLLIIESGYRGYHAASVQVLMRDSTTSLAALKGLDWDNMLCCVRFHGKMPQQASHLGI